MDEKLRKLYRAIVDDETAARYVAESVRLGENTRERVIQAARLQHPAAILLEPKEAEIINTGAMFEELSKAVVFLTEKEEQQVYNLLNIVQLNYQSLRSALSNHRNFTIHGQHDAFKNYREKTLIQQNLIAKILLKL